MSTLIKALRFVGDLDSDFYRDERQRDIWNEASAIGFQFVVWVSLIAAAILPWIGGRTGAWVALGLLLVWFLGSMATIVYARTLDVDPGVTESWKRPRVLLNGAVTLIAGWGIAFTLVLDSTTASWTGGVCGALVGGAAAAWLIRHRKRKHAERELADDDDA